MTDQDEQGSFDPAVVDALRAALDDDELLREIMQSFLTTAPDLIAALASAQLAGNLRAVSATAHLIKGSALTFGADRLAAMCATLEESPDQAITLAAAVEQEYDELSRALVAYVGP